MGWKIAGMRLSLALMGMMLLCCGCVTQAVWGVKQHTSASAPILMLAPRTGDILVRYDERSRGPFASDPARARTREGVPLTASKTPGKDELLAARAYWLSHTNQPEHPAFVEIPDTKDWVSIPVADLLMQQMITNRQDGDWIWRDPKSAGKKKGTNAPAEITCIAAGRNAAGQPLFITNALPQGCYAVALQAAPPLFIFITNAPPEKGYYAVSYGDRFWLWCDGALEGNYRLPQYSTHEHATVLRVVATPLAVTADTTIVCAVIGAFVFSNGGAAAVIR